MEEHLELKFYMDHMRHLVCEPYSVENLHGMAEFLTIPKHWYHGHRLPHYDIPITMVEDLKSSGIVNYVHPRKVLNIITEGLRTKAAALST